nr:hypothetical protein [Haloglycomyces albus]
MPRTKKVTVRNAQFQQWQALLTNRKKRNRLGQLLVQGVRPISLAMEQGWTIRSLLFNMDSRLSRWATALRESTSAEVFDVTGHLMADLGEKTEDVPELLAVVEQRHPRLDGLEPNANFLGIVLDRPSSPGNLGTLTSSPRLKPGVCALRISDHSIRRRVLG